MSANDKQVAGTHYKTSIEPWDAILSWGLGYLDGNVVKYMSRWHKKGGLDDLYKAQHYLEKLIEQQRIITFPAIKTYNSEPLNPSQCVPHASESLLR